MSRSKLNKKPIYIAHTDPITNLHNMESAILAKCQDLMHADVVLFFSAIHHLSKTIERDIDAVKRSDVC